MKIQKEVDVINDQELRKAIIADINSFDNMERKNEAYRRHLCMKDRTSHFVAAELLKQFDDTTVQEMSYSMTNVSIGRKIIDKLARVYSAGVTRKSDNDANTKLVQEVAKTIDMNTQMKRANRYLRAHRNCMVGAIPCPYEENGVTKYNIQIRVLQPYLYDVVEHEYDKERPIFVVLSDYRASSPQRAAIDPAREGRGQQTVQLKKADPGVKEANQEGEAERARYVWWSKSYHFTTNGKGELVPMGHEESPGKVTPRDIQNPIQSMPWENFAMDQEGQFWAMGGNDVFDGAVQINSMLTNIQHIGVVQGYGQFFMKGKNLPKNIKIGPSKAIILEQESKEDPDPSIGYASASPKLSELKDLVIMHIALLLSSNNLSTRSMATELSGASDFPSGIALVIDKAESIEDVNDQQEIFRKKEPMLFDKIQRWQEVYGKRGLLVEEMQKNMLKPEPVVDLLFLEQRTIMSEKEKLENLKLRKDLGINTMIDLIMIDNPSMTEDDAEKKLLEILNDKIAAKLKAMTEPADPNAADPNKDPNAEQPVEVDNEGDSKPGKSEPDNNDD